MGCKIKAGMVWPKPVKLPLCGSIPLQPTIIQRCNIMKAPDPGLVAKQRELEARVTKRQDEAVEANRKARAARKALDEFITNHSDVVAKQRGFERQEAWKEWNLFVQTNPFIWFEEWFKNR